MATPEQSAPELPTPDEWRMIHEHRARRSMSEVAGPASDAEVEHIRALPDAYTNAVDLLLLRLDAEVAKREQLERQLAEATRHLEAQAVADEKGRKLVGPWIVERDELKRQLAEAREANQILREANQMREANQILRGLLPLRGSAESEKRVAEKARSVLSVASDIVDMCIDYEAFEDYLPLLDRWNLVAPELLEALRGSAESAGD